MNEEDKLNEDIVFYDINFEGSCFESKWNEDFIKLDQFIDSMISSSLGEAEYKKLISGYYSKKESSNRRTFIFRNN